MSNIELPLGLGRTWTSAAPLEAPVPSTDELPPHTFIGTEIAWDKLTWIRYCEQFARAAVELNQRAAQRAASADVEAMCARMDQEVAISKGLTALIAVLNDAKAMLRSLDAKCQQWQYSATYDDTHHKAALERIAALETERDECRRQLICRHIWMQELGSLERICAQCRLVEVAQG